MSLHQSLDALRSDTQQFDQIRLILGDQLNADHSWFQQKNDRTLYVILELLQEQRYVKHHIQKICAFFKSMENFATALADSGHQVLHLNLDESAVYETINSCLLSLCHQLKCQRLEYQRPDEYRLMVQLRSLSDDLKHAELNQLHIEESDSEHFILPYEAIPNYFKANKHVRMENFYRKMRHRFNILMEGDCPLGGKWNYDSDNRESFTQDNLDTIPEPLCFENEVEDILDRVSRHSLSHFGTAHTSLLWPCNRKQARKLLAQFCQNCLPNFGRFQDAMTEHSEHAWSLYHSRLSFALNTKMLHPLDVIETAISAYHDNDDISLPQIEGFVRQILGWREYVRGMYWTNMPEVQQKNALDAQQALPKWFWDGATKMNCVSRSISQSLEYAYAHHIQRLMIIGNFSLLAGLNPDDVEAWYLGVYIDAIEWVELPNTRGMALSADKGLIATKPYAASGNYINKMSDHCKQCHYNVKAKVGDRACPFNSLYWHFLDRHKETFQKNPRMALPYKTWQKMQDQQKSQILDQADDYLSRLNTL